MAGVTIANFSSRFNVGLITDIFNGSADSITGAVSVTYDFGPVPAAVPEPSSMLLLLAGLFFLLTAEAIRKRRQRAVA
jgi:PEP-CTERM motif